MLTMWPACLRTHSLVDQIVAAAEAGFGAIAVNSATYVAARSGGASASQIRQIAHDHGIRISWIDAVTGWLPIRYPSRSPELKGFLDHDLDIAFEMAAELGAMSILAVGCFDHGAIDRQQQVDCFGDLCRRAAESDLQVGLEFIPMWGIPTLRAAMEIIDAAGAANGGLVFDTWHFFRSDPDTELLSTIPGDSILAVQVADARWEIKGRDLQDDCLEYRLQPGDGDFPLGPIVAHLAQVGVSDFGPEIFSAELDALSAKQAADQCAQKARALLQNIEVIAA